MPSLHVEILLLVLHQFVDFDLLLLFDLHHGCIDGVLDDEAGHAGLTGLSDSIDSAEGLL